MTYKTRTKQIQVIEVPVPPLQLDRDDVEHILNDIKNTVQDILIDDDEEHMDREILNKILTITAEEFFDNETLRTYILDHTIKSNLRNFPREFFDLSEFLDPDINVNEFIYDIGKIQNYEKQNG